MSRTALLAGTAMICVAAAAGVGSIASAGDVQSFDSRVRIFEGPPAFHGRVTSNFARCERYRNVRLLRRKRAGRPARVLGTDRTNRRGRWAITEPRDFTLTSGIYFARVRRAVLDTPVPTVCEPDRSRKLVVD